MSLNYAASRPSRCLTSRDGRDRQRERESDRDNDRDSDREGDADGDRDRTHHRWHEVMSHPGVER